MVYYSNLALNVMLLHYETNLNDWTTDCRHSVTLLVFLGC